MESTTQNLSKSYQYIPNFVTEAEEEYLLRKISETPQPKWKNVTNRRLQIWGGHIGPGNTLITQPLPPFLTSYPKLIERIAATSAFDESTHKTPNHVIINEYKPGEGIMPHEDGPSYYPVVATISLGSHAVFHYHRYLPETESSSAPAPDTTPGMVASSSRDVFTGPSSQGGRAIDPKPVLSLLLEPRSVIITSGALYKEHLHCIQEVKEDWIIGAEPAERAGATDAGPDTATAYRIDNWESIEDEKMRTVVRTGGVLERATRVSLTCRDVEKTRKVGLPGFGNR
ncbi:hypothetical protein M408DRAFT_231459 [Serendipita vermifera MAFF 305830]|uniref:Fe2OG dioxygenase domain-containing protein n=1 Tax=Serendipita vermifera MAFF 305830 TaxID=933852 RepID=A0A0C3AX94_SERVB|nr:hypothetical protein M408DRAFT_231459 [Serendipita vermifera MAFF 305830]